MFWTGAGALYLNHCIEQSQNDRTKLTKKGGFEKSLRQNDKTRKHEAYKDLGGRYTAID